MKRIKNNKGVAIVTVLFFLVIVTVLAAGAIMLATVQIKVSGSIAQMESARSTAEGAINFVIPLIQSVHYDHKIPGTDPNLPLHNSYTSIVSTPTLVFELTDPSQWNNFDNVEGSPNVAQTLGAFMVATDIDAIGASFMPGGTVEASWTYHKSAENPLVSGYKITARASTPSGRFTSKMCQVIWLKAVL